MPACWLLLLAWPTPSAVSSWATSPISLGSTVSGCTIRPSPSAESVTLNRPFMNWMRLTRFFVDSHGPQCILFRLLLSCRVRRSLWRHNRSLCRPHVSCARRSSWSGQVDERIRTFAAVSRNCFLRRSPHCRQVSTTSSQSFQLDSNVFSLQRRSLAWRYRFVRRRVLRGRFHDCHQW